MYLNIQVHVRVHVNVNEHEHKHEILSAVRATFAARSERVNIAVVDPGEGVCADPVNGGAILWRGGPSLRGGNKERQLSPDKERDKT
jgi:hypothetical protein